ncbi:HNH endonuclease [Acrocarpospora macrocephala]|uniref:HNH endonuclease n=1 Tax=Acrocarpospora macrocephala TaxID=150177 RepID=A0A5M3WGI3_9ACTN|nr:HNH endonuclease signature motif containing protein [Acrocarpospora macrocephala]GES07400.1 HNH endonuclease [Acrocarpospora macrocephala]
MPAGRPALPAQLKRDLLVEAGHRCAIPTCRAAAPLEFEHIDDWERVKKHEFANMIVLCANCHGRKGNGPGQIDRKALRQYKANLALLNSRYGDLERRILVYFAKVRDNDHILLPPLMHLLVMYLVEDGLLAHKPELNLTQQASVGGVFSIDLSATDTYVLTSEGRAFVDRWVAAQPLD